MVNLKITMRIANFKLFLVVLDSILQALTIMSMMMLYVTVSSMVTLIFVNAEIAHAIYFR